MKPNRDDLYSLEEASKFIDSGFLLMVSGPKHLLNQLPSGKWIGGSTYYVMTLSGGKMIDDRVFLNFLDDRFAISTVKFYDTESLDKIPEDYPLSGASFMILPGVSECATKYSTETCFNADVINSPIIGWVSGVIWEKVGTDIPMVINGMTGETHENKALVMHCDLPEDVSATVGIINIFEPDQNDTIEFEEQTVNITNAIINGEKRNLFEYLNELGRGVDQPLIVDYSGAKINVSIFSMDEATKTVNVWAPVFPNYTYNLTKPIENYEEKFQKEIDRLDTKEITFSCNCMYNYFFGNLEGKKTGDVIGPITFGEIAYLGLNQTLVYLTLEEF